MSSTNPTAAQPSNLIARVRSILMSPAATWDVIDGEPATIAGLYTNYVVLLAAIPVVARVIHATVFGYGAFGFSYRPPILTTLVGAVVSYLVSLAAIFVFALVIDELAPRFGGEKNRTQAFKVAAYSATASWVASAFSAVPMLGIVGLLGLYSLYLLYLGLPRVMKAPADRAVAYTATTVVVMIVVSLVAAVIINIAAAPFGGLAVLSGMDRGFAHTGGPTVGTLNLPGGSVNLGQMAAAAQQAEATAKAQQTAMAGGSVAPGAAGAIQPVAPDTLKALLPPSLPGFPRTEVSDAGGGVAGVGAAGASATYASGNGSISLQVTDMGPLGAMAGAINVQSSKETATGYEKVGTVNGRMTTEDYDRQNRSGKYSVLVGSRFMVEADGSGVDVDALKTAVSSVPLDKLEGIAHPG